MLVITEEELTSVTTCQCLKFRLQGKISLFVTESTIEVDNIGEYLAGDAGIAAQKHHTFCIDDQLAQAQLSMQDMPT